VLRTYSILHAKAGARAALLDGDAARVLPRRRARERLARGRRVGGGRAAHELAGLPRGRELGWDSALN